MSTFRCKVCGSTDVELRAWIKPNKDNECTQTDDFSDVVKNREDCYCCQCEDYMELVIED